MPKSLYSITIIETLLLNGIAELLFIELLPCASASYTAAGIPWGTFRKHP